VRTTRRALLAAAIGRGDTAALAAPLRTQLLALACTQAVLEGQSVPTGERRVLVRTLRDHARVHAAALEAAAAVGGGFYPPGPKLDRELARERISGRPGHLRGERDALNLLLDVERIAIGAAYVALGTVGDPATCTLLAQLMASGAQHEAVLHEALHPGDVTGAIRYGIVQGTRA
jgi:hypothetical protein